MMYAIVNGFLSEPFKSGKGTCPTCKTAVLAKCGNVNIHHWAHINIKDCDNWKENEGLWHRSWKLRFPPHFREITYKNHRADVKLNNLAIEFQHSPISVSEVEARENHWKDIFWVVDLRNKKGLVPQTNYLEWKNAYKWITASKGALLLDTDFGLFSVYKKIKPTKKPLRLYGKFLRDHDHFIWKLRNNHEFHTFE